MQVNEAGGLKAFLFHRGYSAKLRALNAGWAHDKVRPSVDRQGKKGRTLVMRAAVT